MTLLKMRRGLVRVVKGQNQFNLKLWINPQVMPFWKSLQRTLFLTFVEFSKNFTTSGQIG